MRDTIRNKIKLFFAFLIILFLLPYIISVFINGKNAVQGADSDNASVYLAEMLAGETYEENLKKCQQAAQETKGIVLLYHETFAWTPFHQSSNGKTRDVQEVLGNADYPYITAKECPLDKAAEDEIQVHLIEYKEIQKRCREFLVAEEQKKAENGYGYEDFEIQEWDSSGYVRKMRIGETICTGDQFRDALKLPSSSFSFYESPHGLKIATVGKGHGFGMSQWTAQEMAKDGKNYEEILQYFYEGTELHHLDE